MMNNDVSSSLLPLAVTLPMQLERWRLLTEAQHNALSMAQHLPLASVALPMRTAVPGMVEGRRPQDPSQ